MMDEVRVTVPLIVDACCFPALRRCLQVPKSDMAAALGRDSYKIIERFEAVCGNQARLRAYRDALVALAGGDPEAFAWTNGLCDLVAWRLSSGFGLDHVQALSGLSAFQINELETVATDAAKLSARWFATLLATAKLRVRRYDERAAEMDPLEG